MANTFSGKKIDRFHVNVFTLLLITLATASAIYYAVFLLNPLNMGTPIFYYILLLAECYVLFHNIIGWFTILAGSRDVRDIHYYDAKKRILSGEISPNIDVFITVFGEPLNIIKETVTKAIDMKLKHQVYILDDGKSDEVKALAQELKVKYIRRESNVNAKAGNINNALSLTKGEYFAIFDADFTPHQDFILKTLPFFEDERVAFVQTPQVYQHSDNLIGTGAATAQKVFYKLICPGKNVFNSAFCVGTNVIFRRSIIMSELGGMYDKSKSEDIWTSYILHQKGYRSVFLEETLAMGLVPDNAIDYLKQQQRWATGAFEIFFKKNPLFTKLSIDQKIQYFDTSIHYFAGLAIPILIFMPAIQLIFGTPPITAYSGFQDWIIHYLPLIVFQYLIILEGLGRNFISSIIVTFASYGVYIKALINVLLNRDTVWEATNASKKSTKGKKLLGDYLDYHFITIFILSTSIVVGLINMKDLNTTLINIFWVIINIIIFYVFIKASFKSNTKL